MPAKEQAATDTSIPMCIMPSGVDVMAPSWFAAPETAPEEPPVLDAPMPVYVGELALWGTLVGALLEVAAAPLPIAVEPGALSRVKGEAVAVAVDEA